MPDPNQSRDRLITLFVIGLLIFNYPLLSIVEQAHFVLGLPVLFWYLFLLWAGFIAFVAIVIRRDAWEEPREHDADRRRHGAE